jgi:hypothetical protein
VAGKSKVLKFKSARVAPVGTLEEPALVERRESKRFTVDWAIKVSAPGDDGSAFEVVGVLRDISATGAYGLFTHPFEVGPSVTVWVRLPLRREGWISYPAGVLRIESRDLGSGIAFIFDAVRPSFVADAD